MGDIPESVTSLPSFNENLASCAATVPLWQMQVNHFLENDNEYYVLNGEAHQITKGIEYVGFEDTGLHC